MSHSFSTICAFCGNEHQLATGVAKHGTRAEPYPDDGAAMLCISCGQFNIADRRKAGGMRRPTKRERRDLASNPIAQKTALAWRAVLGAKGQT